MLTIEQERTVRGACPHDCPDTCALRITVSGDRVVRVEGDPDHPATDGVLCTKVARYAERTHHPDRLTQPLRRVGPKGSGQFEAVSWEVAITEIAARLTEIAARDPQRIVPYSYAGTMGFVQGDGLAQRFFHALGASRLDATICSAAGSNGLASVHGGSVGMSVEQFDHARLILLWGTNPVTSSVHLWRRIQAAKRQGAVVVAIDPFESDTAQKCDRWLALRPGTDAALALALIHVLIAEDLLDRPWIEQHTEGFDALAQRATLSGGELLDLTPVEGDGAGGGWLQAEGHAAERGLAGARLADEAERFAAIHGEVHAVNGANGERLAD
jgi:anaerobic selenocysteine-containing dehydrogenase